MELESATPSTAIGNLRITTATWVKASPAQAINLEPADKCRAYPTQVIPFYRRFPDRAGHYNVEVRIGGGLKSIYCYSLHAGIQLQNEPHPDKVGSSLVIKPKVYDLVFKMALSSSTSLLEGVLQFRKDEVVYNEVRATSSVPGRQYKGAWERKGGLIPPSDVCEAGWSVKTTPIYMPDVRGVSGNFYPISPFLIQTNGAERGDFGIHADANAPGSLGCIVATTDKGWAATQREFKLLEKLGIRVVDLIVDYV